MSLLNPQPISSAGPADSLAGQGSAFQTPESGTPGVSKFGTPFTRVLQGWQGRQASLPVPTSDASLRHGSAAPGSAQRIRTPRGRGRGETRIRGNSGLSPVSTSGQANSPRRDERSGPEEENHWGAALVQVAD